MMPVSNQWRQYGQQGLEFAKEVYTRFGEDRVALSAGAISFFTLLSLVPLVLLAVTIGVPAFSPLLDSFRDPLGPALYSFLRGQIDSIAANRGVSTVVALVFGFWSGSQIFLILESAMNLAWHAQRKRPYLQRRVLAIIMVMIFGLLLAIAFFAANFIRFLASLAIPLWGHRAEELPWLITSLVTIVIPILLISSLFAVIYQVLPTRRVTFRTVLPGSLFAGVLWLLMLHLFGWYAANAESRYQLLYGSSLAGLVLMMLLFYYSAFILLLGAEISATYHRWLVEAGNKEERLVEESEHPVYLEDELSKMQARTDNAENSLVYYGYRSEE